MDSELGERGCRRGPGGKEGHTEDQQREQWESGEGEEDEKKSQQEHVLGISLEFGG